MIFVGKYEEMNPGNGFPSIKEFFEKDKYDGQDKIIWYLKNGTANMCRAEIPKDVVSGKSINMDYLCMSDGEYTWFNTLAYYVEKYNLRLPKDFEEKILSN